MLDCTQTITVWNRYKTPINKQEPEQFFCQRVHNCKYTTNITRTASGAGVNSSVVIVNSQLVIIPQNELYKSPAEWLLLDASERELYFTLQPSDFVALGEHYIDISGNETLLRSKLGSKVFSIRAIQDNTQRPQGGHFKVEGV